MSQDSLMNFMLKSFDPGALDESQDHTVLLTSSTDGMRSKCLASSTKIF